MSELSRHTRIITKLMDLAYALDKIGADKERIACLVSDEEWRQIWAYSHMYDTDYREHEVTSGHFLGIEIVKRSAICGRPNSES